MTATNEKESIHISVVLDRSGSMSAIKDDIIGGFNQFLQQQQKAYGERATLTLVQFDGHDPFEVIHSFKPLSETPLLTADTYVPRGSTPLLDAVGRNIQNLGNWLANRKPEDRPGRVVVVVVTDGCENASREFRLEQVRHMIEEKEALLGWQFIYLSSDLDAVTEAIGTGFQGKAVMSYDRTKDGVREAWSSTTDRVIAFSMRDEPDVCFKETDRAKQRSESRRS